MKTSGVFAAVGLLSAFICNAADSAPEMLIRKLRSLAGANAQDCGSVVLRGSPDAAIACAKEANAAGKAYWIAVEFQGTDSLVWQGAARDEGNKLWVLFYDIDPSGGSGSNPTLSVVPCREILFATEGDDIIGCKPMAGGP